MKGRQLKNYSIQQRNDIIIINADTGNCTAALDKLDYHDTLMSFLQDLKVVFGRFFSCYLDIYTTSVKV